MIQPKFLYTYGGVELLDDVQPLWEQLNQHHAAVSPYFAADFHAKTFSGRKNALLAKYSNGELRIDIAQADGRNVGYVFSAIHANGVGEIESIFIEKKHRGQAIGDQLMQRALDWLDSVNAHTKVINVAVGNESAYKFYERYGFYPRVVTLKQGLTFKYRIDTSSQPYPEDRHGYR
jgi:ribosomal protein S18 acetylase RimI-like enzyme